MPAPEHAAAADDDDQTLRANQPTESHSGGTEKTSCLGHEYQRSFFYVAAHDDDSAAYNYCTAWG